MSVTVDLMDNVRPFIFPSGKSTKRPIVGGLPLLSERREMPICALPKAIVSRASESPTVYFCRADTLFIRCSCFSKAGKAGGDRQRSERMKAARSVRSRPDSGLGSESGTQQPL